MPLYLIWAVLSWYELQLAISPAGLCRQAFILVGDANASQQDFLEAYRMPDARFRLYERASTLRLKPPPRTGLRRV